MLRRPDRGSSFDILPDLVTALEGQGLTAGWVQALGLHEDLLNVREEPVLELGGCNNARPSEASQ